MNRNIIVIGASAGGVEAVPRLLSSLPASIPAAFFVTLHIPPHSESYMPRLITRSGLLPAEHACDGTPIQTGRVYVAPPDYHLLVDADVIRLSHGPKENRHRPDIDPLFRSAAATYGERVAGVLLTGNLDDGAAGLREVQQHRGLTIVQDPQEAPYPEMPRSALQAIRPDHCLPLKQIESLLARLPNPTSKGAKMKAKKRSNNSNESPDARAGRTKPGSTIPVVCPECQGPLWEFRDGKLLRFECLVGHRYTLASLLESQSEELETALWVALRAIEERLNLQSRLAKEAHAAGHERSRRMFEARAAENQKHARLLRQILERIGE